MPNLRVLAERDVAECLKNLRTDLVSTLAFFGRLLHMSLKAGSSIQVPERISLQSSLHTYLFMPALNHTSLIHKVVAVPDVEKGKSLTSNTAVFDTQEGSMKAIIKSTQLTAFRTAIGSLMSCKISCRQELKKLVVFGAGSQAVAHITLFVEAYPTLETVEIISRTQERLVKLVEMMHTAFPHCTFVGLTTDSLCSTITRAVSAADCIICATPSTEALFDVSDVKPGAHVCLVGSFKRHMREVNPDVIHRAGKIIVDDAKACSTEAGELIEARVNFDELSQLGDFFDDQGHLQVPQPRENASGDAISLYKSVGTGLMDIAVTNAVLDIAESRDLGTVVENY